MERDHRLDATCAQPLEHLAVARERCDVHSPGRGSRWLHSQRETQRVEANLLGEVEIAFGVAPLIAGIARDIAAFAMARLFPGVPLAIRAIAPN